MNKSYLYTETAFHHEGDINFLKKLIIESKNAGAKGVKFQVLTDVHDFVSIFHKSYEDLKSYCFTIEEWDEIFRYTTKLKLDIILMPLNIRALELVQRHPVKYLDIHSVSFNDEELLASIKKVKKDIILGVGGRTLEEIFQKKKEFGGYLKVLMVGFQSFPSKIEKIKLAKIAQLQILFPELTIGYTDHSAPEDDFAILSNDYARLLGAKIFEKHISLPGNSGRVDSASAVPPEVIEKIINRLNFIDQYIDNRDDSFVMGEEELVYRDRQLICVAKEDYRKGEILNDEKIRLKMFDDPQNCFFLPQDLFKRKLKKDIKKDQPFTGLHLQ